jgi:SulP family sulfate permease
MLTKILPFLAWFKDLSFGALKRDAMAGMTVALVLIPQSMAYAQLAGLPAYYGLYAAFLPPLIASLFGSSRQLATGPVAVVSLMTAASLEPLATAGSESYIAYAIALSVFVGLFQLSLGVFRLGLVVNFLSHPVVNGFTNAAALIIASSQLSKMFGVSVDSAEHHYETVRNVLSSAMHYTHWPTLGMGLLALAIMIGLKRLSPKIPAVLAAVVVTSVLSWATGFEHNTRLELSAIKSPPAIAAVTAFNAATGRVRELSTERREHAAALETAKKQADFNAQIAAESELMRVNHEMEQQKLAAQHQRTALRSMLFAMVREPAGPSVYPADALPAGAETDGRTWRIKVGNVPLSPEGLLLSGGGAVVGAIPEGLPSFSLPKFDTGAATHLLSYAMIIAILGFMEAISIAKAIADKTGQRLDPNQELIGQGLANLLGATTSSYPVSGSFSRSAVNLQAGAVTGMSSVITSVVVLGVLLFFTPLLYHLPQAVLAAVIMMAVVGLLNFSGIVHAWQAQKFDGVAAAVTFVATLVFAPHLDKGIMIGVALSLGVFLYKSMRPKVSSLSLAEDNILRSAKEYELAECEHVDVIRFEGPLFFANASYLEDTITDRRLAKPNLRHIILVAKGINGMDASGMEALSRIVDTCRRAKVDFSLAGVNESVMGVLRRCHLVEKLGQDHIFPNAATAIRVVHERAEDASCRCSCPLLSFLPMARPETCVRDTAQPAPAARLGQRVHAAKP